MKPNIVITGAAGYLGGIVLRRLQPLLQTGEIGALVALDLREVPDAQRLAGVRYAAMDVRDPNLDAILRESAATTVLHLAAVLDSNSLPRQIQYEIDVLGTRNVAEACLKTGVKRLIATSSGAAYGYHPDNPSWLRETDPLRGNEIFPYAAHKRQAEAVLAEIRAKNPTLEQTIFRVGTILGKNTQNLITNLFEKPAIIGVSGSKSPFVFIWDEDVAECLKQAVFSDKTGIFNLAGDGALPAASIAQILGKKYRQFSAGFLRGALRVLRFLRLTRYTPDQVLFIQHRPVLDNHALRTEFGFTPQKTSLETFLFFLEARGWKPATDPQRPEILYPNSLK